MNRFCDDLSRLDPAVRSVVANDTLFARPARDPDYKEEVEAMRDIVRTLLDRPADVLARLSQALLRLCGADSAGVSLAGRRDGQRVFVWQATAGYLEPHRGHELIYEESPCGAVLDTDSAMLMIDPVRAFGDAVAVTPYPNELLLMPFAVNGRTVGTVWVVSQSDKQFDAEDARLAAALSDLAALAYQVLIRVENFEVLHRSVQQVADDAIAFSRGAGHA